MTRHVFDQTRPGTGALRLRRYMRLDALQSDGIVRRFAKLAAGRTSRRGPVLKAFTAIDRGREV